MKIRLFLSSPGDVPREREIVHEVADELNRIFSAWRLDLTIDVLDWRTHVAPRLGNRAQQIINEDIGKYDVFVGIMWKRFGTPTGVAESGTEEEFRLALADLNKNGSPEIMFYFSHAPYSPQEPKELDQWRKVLEFRAELEKLGLYWRYDSERQFEGDLRFHLFKYIRDKFGDRMTGEKPPEFFERYLKYVNKDCMYIDVRGLVTGTGRVHQFRIDQLYIPLKTGARDLAKGKDAGTDGVSKEIALQDALVNPRLIVRGDPGSGKSTFLRLLAFSLSAKKLGEALENSTVQLHWSEPLPLPILVSLGRLTKHIADCREKHDPTLPAQPDSPECLLHFLDRQSAELGWYLQKEDFRREMEKGNCLIMLDGLDEAPDLTTRDAVGRMAANLVNAYPSCRIVLTSRPAALAATAMPMDFNLVDIADLDLDAMKSFLQQWSAALYSAFPEKASQYRQELLEALQSRPEIRLMAKTPVMLTAMAVVHWNETRLPEQRAELYESILTWLFRQREQRPGRLKSTRCRKLLQKLALAMFTHSRGRQRQLGPVDAAEILMNDFSAGDGNSSRDMAEYFIRDEVIDSGVIVERGNRIEFWHLSFQEYLAAFELGGLAEKDLSAILFEANRLYHSEWREVVLLLAGILYKQGEARVNHFVDAIIEPLSAVDKKKALPEIARAVGLVGAIVRDLTPFDFKPENPQYASLTPQVMAIFDAQTFRTIPVQTRIEAADALSQVADPRIPLDIRKTGDHWVRIPAGRFFMGAQKQDKGRNYDAAADHDEAPVHEVELEAFSINRFPVTVLQYQRFMEEGGYKDELFWRNGGFGQFATPEGWEKQQLFGSRPVVGVSWYEAVAFCCWAGVRLPTEAEWERAARGPGDLYRKYPWGNDEPNGETANYDDSKIGHATPVGIFPLNRSPEGVMDMAGNVREWCQDLYDSKYYTICKRAGLSTNPPGPKKGDSRVVRGGSFVNNADGMRCSYRDVRYPVDRVDNVGFRVVRGPQS